MHPEAWSNFRIGPATALNAAFYPNAAGAKPDNLLPGLDGTSNVINAQQGANSAVMGTATVQRQFSADGGTTWTNDGAAVAAITYVAVTLFRRFLYRWQITGSGNITGNDFTIG